YGDYYGIGAGAHGKVSTDNVYRTRKHRQPKDYLEVQKPYLAEEHIVKSADLSFEFMLNTTRLQQPIENQYFMDRTGLCMDDIAASLLLAEQKGLICRQANSWQVTDLGRRYTNDLQAIFLDMNEF